MLSYHLCCFKWILYFYFWHFFPFVLSNHYAWHTMKTDKQHLIPQIWNRSCGQKGLIRVSKNMILILKAINKTSICTDVEVEIWLSQPLEFTQFVGICWFGRWWRASFLGTWASFFIWNTQPQATGTLPQTGIPFLGCSQHQQENLLQVTTKVKGQKEETDW